MVLYAKLVQIHFTSFWFKQKNSKQIKSSYLHNIEDYFKTTVGFRL